MNVLQFPEQLLRTVLIDYAPRFSGGRRIFEILAEPYLAGHSLEEGIATAKREYATHRRHATLDVLGEGARTIEEAQRYRTAYRSLVDRVAQEFSNREAVSISLKPTAICVADAQSPGTLLPETTLRIELEKLVVYAAEHGVKVTLDMEDHYWTDISLETAKDLWDTGYQNLGIVLQSRLDRTSADIQALFVRDDIVIPREKMSVRACIGIYVEPETLATNNRYEAKQRLMYRIAELFAQGVYVEIATHDPDVVHTIISSIIEPMHIPRSRFEFQFLKGVQNAYDLEAELMKHGYTVRYYMPVEIQKGDGIPYMQRRLRQNPDLFRHGVKNLFQQLRGRKLLISTYTS